MTIDWGDGTANTSATTHKQPGGQISVSGSHAYQQSGAYTVKAIRQLQPIGAGGIDYIPLTLLVATIRVTAG